MDEEEREREREIGREQAREAQAAAYNDDSDSSGSSFSNFVWALAWVLVTAIIISGLYYIGTDAPDPATTMPTDQKINIEVNAPGGMSN